MSSFIYAEHAKQMLLLIDSKPIKPSGVRRPLYRFKFEPDSSGKNRRQTISAFQSLRSTTKHGRVNKVFFCAVGTVAGEFDAAPK